MKKIDESILGGAVRVAARERGFIEGWKPHAKTLVLLEQIDRVLIEYNAYLPLTVRQVYYRLVGAFDYPKTENGYENLGELINKARRAERIDMDVIRDDGLTREAPTAWADPAAVQAYFRDIIDGYRRERTDGQEVVVMLWCEAAGMVPQLATFAAPYGVTVLSSGGFDSVTAKHNFGRECANLGRPVVVLHLGDHDPSGVHVALSLAEDVTAFASAYGGDVTFYRLAVTPEQIRDLGIITAPAKKDDNRAFVGGTAQLEAIAPDVLAGIVENGILEFTDLEVLNELRAREAEERERLQNWLASMTK